MPEAGTYGVSLAVVDRPSRFLLWVYLCAIICLDGAYVSAAWEKRVRNAVTRVEAA